ncbi:phosphoribosyltransferase family protein [Vibrio hannami]|uniref:phosphoribosyltransferase family protein n=1 Tax=Vibrio hannami TaxID=2717094 RepID=UPI00240FF35C|nr:phosphoribosyltransferase family protein [Vibrio hannami]MDG3086866.1 phosphoribosyltransferase family protein [Vibrio hannami]
MLSNWIRDKIHRHCTSECDLCGLTINDPKNQSIWCNYCLRYFVATPRCQCCGLTTIENTEKCGRCLKEPPAWDRLYCISDYQPPISNYISGLKYQHNYQTAFDLTSLLATRIKEPAPILIPVPLYWKRQVSRGYNQSEVLAYFLSKHLLNSPIITKNVFQRIKSTPPQQGLSLNERKSNLRGAFKMKAPPMEKHVAIIDDVVTTGSTVRHLCNLLLEFEVEKIDIYCICRTPEPDN